MSDPVNPALAPVLVGELVDRFVLVGPDGTAGGADNTYNTLVEAAQEAHRRNVVNAPYSRTCILRIQEVVPPTV